LTSLYSLPTLKLDHIGAHVKPRTTNHRQSPEYSNHHQRAS
jgi:hypothetical protein